MAHQNNEFSIQDSVGIHSSLDLNIVSDQIGRYKNTGVTANYSYTILGNTDMKYSFSISAGLHNFMVDYNKINPENPDSYLTGIESKILPNIGVGVYVHSYN